MECLYKLDIFCIALFFLKEGRMSSYYKRLNDKVLELSNSKQWDLAVVEWYIYDCKEDDDQETSCVCGKENLRYLFTIVNSENGNTLYPIGSSCIKKFGRHDLSEETEIYEKLFKLSHAVENNEFITLTSQYFSRKVLKYLYEDGAFSPNQYNNYNPESDYNFLLEMFNKRDKENINLNQERKIKAIIVSSIRPYLSKKL